MTALLAVGISTGVTAQAEGNSEGYEVYEWRAPDGTIEYSDEPRPGAKTKHVEEPMTVAPSAVVGSSRRPVRTDDHDAGSSKVFSGYRSVSIESPRPDDVLWVNPTVPVTVSVSADPPLLAGHSVALRLNGDQLAARTRGTFQLNDLNRGTYSVQAEILDTKGEVLARSATTSFHVKRPTTGAP